MPALWRYSLGSVVPIVDIDMPIRLMQHDFRGT